MNNKKSIFKVSERVVLEKEQSIYTAHITKWSCEKHGEYIQFYFDFEAFNGEHKFTFQQAGGLPLIQSSDDPLFTLITLIRGIVPAIGEEIDFDKLLGVDFKILTGQNKQDPKNPIVLNFLRF